MLEGAGSLIKIKLVLLSFAGGGMKHWENSLLSGGLRATQAGLSQNEQGTVSPAAN